jgi:hypothetical protein
MCFEARTEVKGQKMKTVNFLKRIRNLFDKKQYQENKNKPRRYESIKTAEG